MKTSSDTGRVKRFPRRAHNPETAGSTPAPGTNFLTESEFDLLLFVACVAQRRLMANPPHREMVELLADFRRNQDHAKANGEDYVRDVERTGSVFAPLHGVKA